MKAATILSLTLLLVGCSKAPAPVAESHGVGSIVRLDPAFDSLVPQDAQIEKVAGGFQFTEGRSGGPMAACGSVTWSATCSAP